MCVWALLFTKCTNGVADKNTCVHFQKLIESGHQIDIGIYKRPAELGSILRCTSKWIKNCVSDFFKLFYVIIQITVFLLITSKWPDMWW